MEQGGWRGRKQRRRRNTVRVGRGTGRNRTHAVKRKVATTRACHRACARCSDAPPGRVSDAGSTRKLGRRHCGFRSERTRRVAVRGGSARESEVWPAAGIAWYGGSSGGSNPGGPGLIRRVLRPRARSRSWRIGCAGCKPWASSTPRSDSPRMSRSAARSGVPSALGVSASPRRCDDPPDLSVRLPTGRTVGRRR